MVINSGAKILGLVLTLTVGGALSGCVGGGTTYGTGVSQEKQTIDDLANMLTFRKKKTAIDYKARPDLVVPEDRDLVSPVEQAAAEDDANWPESPERRIARVRAEADEANATSSGELEFSKSKKKFRSAGKRKIVTTEAPIGEGIPNVSCDPDGETMRKCTDEEIRNAVLAERQRLAGASGASRKYLTEPPVEYRTPSETAPIGDAGYTAAEREKAERLRKESEKEIDPRG